ncbi:acyltransferase [Aerococcus urinaeequi]|uniref:Acyltransferase n=1 Tax=Aerococcus urinaeequi TaxID=51665 RepID=A0AAE9XNK2_9LACT|nr:acyltransferase [Aerococcus urinaeequi]WCG37220.1 acyltransferase [Aerococcus urinaeequi]
MENAKTGRDIFQKNRNIINLFVKLIKCFPLNFRKKFFIFFRNKKGLSGMAIRYIILKSLAKSLGDNVSVHPGVYLLKPENLSIANNVSIHPMCYIDATGGIQIGNNVSIAHGTSILSSTHEYSDINIPIKYQKIRLGEVVIEDNVWIGAKVTILYQNTISSGAIVGANSLVTRDVVSKSVVGGNPAKLLKMRGN